MALFFYNSVMKTEEIR